MLVTLSLDRLDAVRNPLSFGQQESRASHLVAGAWALSALFSLPAVFLNSQVTIKGMPQCWIRLQAWQWRFYLTSVCVTLFCVPALIIACCYVLIVVRIWRKPDHGLTPPPSSAVRKAVLSTCTCHAYNSRLSFRLNNHSRQRKRLSLEESSSADPSSASSHAAMLQSGTKAALPQQRTCPHHKSRGHVQMRSSSEGVIPKARIKTIKMTFVIVLGKPNRSIDRPINRLTIQVYNESFSATLRSLRHLLVSVFCVGHVASVRLHSVHSTVDRHFHFHSKSGAAQLGGQPDHLFLLLLQGSLPMHSVQNCDFNFE